MSVPMHELLTTGAVKGTRDCFDFLSVWLESISSACRSRYSLWAQQAWGVLQGQPAALGASIGEVRADKGSALAQDFVGLVLASDSWMVLR